MGSKIVNPYWFKLTDEQRIGVVKCLHELGISLSDIARAAGVTPAAVSKWVSGTSAPTVDKLEALYNAMPDTVSKCLPAPPVTAVEALAAIDVIARALRNPELKDLVIQRLSQLLPGIKPEIAYTVTREDIELFKAKLDAEGITRHTRYDYVANLTRFLNKVGWVLTPETLQKAYTIASPAVRETTLTALKRFIRTVVKVREPQIAPYLYDSIKITSLRPKNHFKVPTLEEVKKVWEEAAKISPCAAAMWGIMAETGVRLDHLHRATLSGLRLDRRRLLLGETAGPKRQPLVFLTDGAAKYIEEVYLPWRKKFLRMTQMETDKLFPCKEATIYKWLREARERAGLPWLIPKLLRKFNAQWLLDKGVDVSDIAMLQGRALPSSLAITVEHYIADYERRLRAVFEANAPRVFPA